MIGLLRFTLFSVLLSFMGVLKAADRPSHLVLPDWYDGSTDPARADEMLQQLRAALSAKQADGSKGDALQRLLDLIQRNDLEGLQRALRDPKIADQLRSIKPDDPAFQQQIQERARRMAEQGQTFDADRLQRLLQDLQKNNNLSRSDSQDPALDTGPRTEPPRLPPITTSRRDTDDAGNRLRPVAEEPVPNSERADRLREWLRQANNWIPDSFRESESVSRFRERLGNREANSGRQLRLPGNIRMDFNLERTFQQAGNWIDRNTSRIRIGRMPDIRMPDLSGSPSLPSLGSPVGGANGLHSLGLMMGLCGALVVIALLARRYLSQSRSGETTDKSPSSGYHMHFHSISTREELIKAFDDLTVLRAGSSALHWNHRRRAQHLIESDATNQKLVERLTGIYETARYAPPQDFLPEEVIAQAKSDLLVLAGMASQ
jgi:hypothetical protein